jgi:hypothetical protein
MDKESCSANFLFGFSIGRANNKVDGVACTLYLAHFSKESRWYNIYHVHSSYSI